MSRPSSFSGTIVYVGPFSFPEGGAASRRILGNALSLRDAGYRVVVGTGQMASSSTPHVYEGIEVVSLNERTSEALPVSLKHAAYAFMGRKTTSWLDSLHPKPVAVILYSGFTPYFMRLIPWCRKNGVPMIFDAVEWYGPKRMAGGRFGMYRWSFLLAMKYYCVRCRNVIAISRYLESYYSERDCVTIRVPPTLDTSKLGAFTELAQSTKLRIGYAGKPEVKDLLNTALAAVMRINEEAYRIDFSVAGMSELELLAFPVFRQQKRSSLPVGIISLGKISNVDALKFVANCDFTILLRPILIDSLAGFPTKVVESMSVGTPVICNLTSDLFEHVFHGISGLVCSAPTIDACEIVLQEALEMNYEQRTSMRRHAWDHARVHFDYRCHVTSFLDFIHKLKVM